MKNLFVRALLVCAGLYGSVILAAQQEEIIVTGTRAPIEAGRLPAAVTVIDREDIENCRRNPCPSCYVVSPV